MLPMVRMIEPVLSWLWRSSTHTHTAWAQPIFLARSVSPCTFAARVAHLYEYATAASQLAAKAEQLPRLAATLAVQKHLSKQQRLERLAAAQKQTLELLERLGGSASGVAGLRRRFVQQARLPDTLPTSLRLTALALPCMLRDVLELAEEEHHYWGLEATAAKRRFRTPRTHQILHLALQIASQQLEHELIGGGRGEGGSVKGRGGRGEGGGGLGGLLTSADRARVATLAERERNLGEAAAAANAALAADDYDEAV